MNCPICSSPEAIELGSLGSVRHFRCRDCGMTYSKDSSGTFAPRRKRARRLSAEDRFAYGFGGANHRASELVDAKGEPLF